MDDLVKYELNFNVGDIYKVGKFFWIEENNYIGFSKDASHAHGLKRCGSVNTQCKIKILGFEEDDVVVELITEVIPKGASAANGAIFMLPLSQILSWPELLKQNNKRQKFLKMLCRKYCSY